MKRSQKKFGIAILILVSLFCVPLSACVLCYPFPVKTAADHILENEIVVFARLDADDPFSYVITRELKGSVDSEHIDYFANSLMRRRLGADPDSVVVFVRGQTGEWLSLGFADKKYQQVIERVVAHQQDWNSRDGVDDRVAFFAQLFDHEDQTIFELAYLELARAPYSTIKEIGPMLPKDRLRSLLSRREYVEWRPLAILLLVQDPSDKDRESLKQAFERFKKFPRKKELAARVTAHIELNGEAAIDEIEDVWLATGDRPLEEIQEVMNALSVQQEFGSPAIRQRISQFLTVAQAKFPQVKLQN